MAQAKSQPVAVISVVQAPTFRAAPEKGQNARALWWASVAAANGKPVQQWLEAVAAKVPSYQPKGKFGKVQKSEPPMGWLKHFIKAGNIKIVSKA